MPGSARAFIEALHRQTQHRQALEKQVIESDIRKSERAQHYTLIGFVAGLLCATAAALTGHEAAAGVIAGMDFVGIGGSYLGGLLVRKSEREGKRERQSKL